MQALWHEMQTSALSILSQSRHFAQLNSSELAHRYQHPTGFSTGLHGREEFHTTDAHGKQPYAGPSNDDANSPTSARSNDEAKPPTFARSNDEARSPTFARSNGEAKSPTFARSNDTDGLNRKPQARGMKIRTRDSDSTNKPSIASDEETLQRRLL